MRTANAGTLEIFGFAVQSEKVRYNAGLVKADPCGRPRKKRNDEECHRRHERGCRAHEGRDVKFMNSRVCDVNVDCEGEVNGEGEGRLKVKTRENRLGKEVPEFRKWNYVESVEWRGFWLFLRGTWCELARDDLLSRESWFVEERDGRLGGACFRARDCNRS
jgi:hypothetical protein